MSPVPQRKLLLADDSVTIQKVVNLTFADEGIEVITVGDGDSAMAKFSEHTPDLVMADVNMPGLSGYEVCEKIRESASSHIPVILLVGSFEPFDEAEAHRVGANDFLTKPFQSIRQLVNKVNELLSNTAAQTNAEEPAAQEELAAKSEDLSEAKTLDSFSVPPQYLSDEPTAATPAVSAYDAADDEMIETSNVVGGYIFDESAKFQSREVDAAEEIEVNNTEEINETAAASGAAEPETDAEQLVATEDEAEEIRTDETNSNLDVNRQSKSFAVAAYSPVAAVQESRETSRASEMFSGDDDDFLEIPYDENDEEYEDNAGESTTPTDSVYKNSPATVTSAVHEEATAEPASESAPETMPEQSAETPAQSSKEILVESIASADVETTPTIQAGQLSAEMIEAIAQRVVEKLSDRAVKEVAWEVVPQHAELIIKKMVEEKMKE